MTITPRKARKKISQREAVRLRREVRLLRSANAWSSGVTIATFGGFTNVSDIARIVGVADDLNHAVVVRVVGTKLELWGLHNAR